MYRKQPEQDGADGIVGLLRETVDGLGSLVSDHVRLAKLELVSDAKRFGRQVGLIVLIAPALLLGYALVCLGVVYVLAPHLGTAPSFFLVGGLHVALGGIGLAVLLTRLRKAPLPMDDTAQEVNRTIATLSASAQADAGSPISHR